MPEKLNFASVCASCGAPPVVQWQRRSADNPGHTVAVFACAAHGITRDLAAHIHAATCTAPAAAHLPGCDCTPEPLAAGPAFATPTPTALPPGW
ncbi:hypothetical protein [Kitasatospora mediocidica]|uniref:hypothetical protein n=1 Tax=Kitasatospora mediocidica TaxID=58352 RepID=UPI000A036FF9|nr:hypothetical protein [Kitasatospora mediocidica]